MQLKNSTDPLVSIIVKYLHNSTINKMFLPKQHATNAVNKLLSFLPFFLSLVSTAPALQLLIQRGTHIVM